MGNTTSVLQAKATTCMSERNECDCVLQAMYEHVRCHRFLIVESRRGLQISESPTPICTQLAGTTFAMSTADTTMARKSSDQGTAAYDRASLFKRSTRSSATSTCLVDKQHVAPREGGAHVGGPHDKP